MASDTKTREETFKMADVEDDCLKESEKCTENRTAETLDGSYDQDYVEERIRVDRRKLEILLQGCF